MYLTKNDFKWSCVETDFVLDLLYKQFTYDMTIFLYFTWVSYKSYELPTL